MTDQERQEYCGLVKWFADFAARKALVWMPVAGSLLAVHRHNSLFIPWDDDFDVALTASSEAAFLELACNSPLDELHPNMAVADCGWRDEDQGHLFKLYDTNSKRQFDRDRPGHAVRFAWPFIDVFVACPTAANKLNCGTITATEAKSLEWVQTADGVRVPVPRRGQRSRRAFAFTALLDYATCDPWVHSTQTAAQFEPTGLISLHEAMERHSAHVSEGPDGRLGRK